MLDGRSEIGIGWEGRKSGFITPGVWAFGGRLGMDRNCMWAGVNMRDLYSLK